MLERLELCANLKILPMEMGDIVPITVCKAKGVIVNCGGQRPACEFPAEFKPKQPTARPAALTPVR